jgi:hypothetical protein
MAMLLVRHPGTSLTPTRKSRRGAWPDFHIRQHCVAPRPASPHKIAME